MYLYKYLQMKKMFIYERDSFMKKRIISVALILSVLFTLFIPTTVSAAPSTLSTEVFDGNSIQDSFTKDDGVAYYKITAEDTKYYKFTFDNQSVEVRTGISIADSFLNLFFGKINIVITDQYDLKLSEFSVRCGYSGNVSLKLNKGSTYYIKVSTNVAGNYRLRINSYTDIGGDSWNTATETLSVGQLISSIDANGDQDWFYFQTDDTSSFYDFNLENISGSSRMYMDVYEYVEGAGQIPLRDTFYISAYSSNTASKQLKLKPNTKYYICIYLESGIGGYQLDINQTLDAVGDTQEDAYKVDTDTKITTALDGNGDTDWYKFTTKAYDAYYYFDIKNLSIRNEYYYLKVVDKDQNELAYKSLYTGYGDMSLNVKLEPNTEYYFKLYGENSTLGNYEFKITDIADKHANEMENATEISPDTLVSENFGGNGDVDWYKFTTKDYDAFYYIDIENLSIRNEYYYLRVLDEDQNEVGYKSLYTGYGDMSLSVKLSPNTEYYIKLYGEFSTVGNYTITVTPHPDYEGDTKEKAAKISINNSQEAELTADSDIDWFKLDLATDTNVRFYTINESGDSKIFEIYSSTNREVAWMRVYGGETGERSQILDAGQYYIKVSGGAGYYTLAVGNCGSAHKEDYSYIKATTDSDGIKKTFCKSCKAVLKKEAVPAIDKIKLSYTKGTYNGSAKKPTVTVYDVNGDVISSSQYTVTYPKAVNVGTYYLKVTFKGKYEGEKSVKYYVIPQASSKLKIKLSATSYTYNGKTKKPSVKVYTSSGKLISSSNYTVVYPSGRKYVGTYKIKIVFKNNFKGTEYVTFKINPAKTPVTKLVPGKKCLKVYVGKSTSVSGYQIQYSTSKSFKAAKTVTTKSYKTNVVTLKSLGSKRTYYVRVRTYKKVGGKTYYSGWSSYKYKKTK